MNERAISLMGRCSPIEVARAGPCVGHIGKLSCYEGGRRLRCDSGFMSHHPFQKTSWPDVVGAPYCRWVRELIR